MPSKRLPSRKRKMSNWWPVSDEEWENLNYPK
jgi:hypothetical protein